MTAPQAVSKRTGPPITSYARHGLPPSPEDVEAFLNDEAADAYEALVDRLLKDPQVAGACRGTAARFDRDGSLELTCRYIEELNEMT